MKKRTLFIIGAVVVVLVVLSCIGCLVLGSLSTPLQTATPEIVIEEWEGVYLGMPADDVLVLHPKSETTEAPVNLGEDSEGLIVRWSYPGAYLILAHRKGEGTDIVTCYRVIEIQLREAP